MRPCKDCNKKERYTTKAGKTYSYCKECNYLRLRAHQKTEKGKATLRKHTRNLQRKRNGFTPEVFNDMLFNQNFKCAICSIEINISSHADHDHETGLARGILCSSCNTLLGRLESKGFDWVDKAKAYLNR
jgi:NMD protein affecting ribosome stability and mRNA decay